MQHVVSWFACDQMRQTLFLYLSSSSVVNRDLLGGILINFQLYWPGGQSIVAGEIRSLARRSFIGFSAGSFREFWN